MYQDKSGNPDYYVGPALNCASGLLLALFFRVPLFRWDFSIFRKQGPDKCKKGTQTLIVDEDLRKKKKLFFLRYIYFSQKVIDELVQTTVVLYVIE
jgi:hypothetical protein